MDAERVVCLHCRRPFAQGGFKSVAPASMCSLACVDRSTAVHETFSQRLRRLRTARRMTQQDLADQLGVTYTAISLWERGRRTPNAQSLAVLAHVFKCSMDLLWRGPRSNRRAS